MSANTIHREAGDQQEGPRLQRLRAISLMLDAIEKSDTAYIYAATEYNGDVYTNHSSEDGTKHYVEENKNYNPVTSFTINSHEITNTLIIFLDIWIKWDLSKKNVFFGVYTSNQIGKENASSIAKLHAIKLPTTPILEILMHKQLPNNINVLNYLKVLLIEKYKEEYARNKKTGNIDIINGFKDSDWLDFFSLIDWRFGQPNAEELEKEVLHKIRQSKFYSFSSPQSEESILSRLIYRFEKKQTVKDRTERFIHAAEIKIIFMEGTTPVSMKGRLPDPVWEQWDQLDPPTDKRSLKEKIIAVCKNYDEKKIKILARRVGNSRLLQSSSKTDKSFLSLKFRIYDKCEEELVKFVKKDRKTLTEEEVDNLLDSLKKVAQQHIQALSTDFNYSISNPTVIEEIILELIDSCYLSPS